MGSVKKTNKQRSADAEQWLKGMHDVRDEVNRRIREFLDEGNRRLQEAANEDEAERTIEYCKELERLLGAVDVYLSPVRVGSPLAQWRRENGDQSRLNN